MYVYAHGVKGTKMTLMSYISGQPKFSFGCDFAVIFLFKEQHENLTY